MHSPYSLTLGCLPLVVSYLTILTIHVSALEYEVAGTLKGARYYNGRVIEDLPPCTFTVFVEDCKWLIRVNDSARANRYIENSYDGTFQYRYSALMQGVAEVPSGSVLSEQVPFFGPHPHIPVIWLALAQACYLDVTGNSSIPPYSLGRVREPIPAEIVRIAREPRLPESITYYNDGFSRQFEKLKLSPPFDRGFKEATYTVQGFTNMASLQFPLHFEFRQYQPSPGARTAADLEVSLQYNGTVTRVSPVCSLSHFAPELSGRIGSALKDYRFVDPASTFKPSFDYQTNRWLSMNEARALPGFAEYARDERKSINLKQELRRGQPQAQPSRSSRILFLLFAAVVLMAPVLLWWKSRTKPRPMQES